MKTNNRISIAQTSSRRGRYRMALQVYDCRGEELPHPVIYSITTYWNDETWDECISRLIARAKKDKIEANYEDFE